MKYGKKEEKGMEQRVILWSKKIKKKAAIFKLVALAIWHVDFSTFSFMVIFLYAFSLLGHPIRKYKKSLCFIFEIFIFNYYKCSLPKHILIHERSITIRIYTI